MLELPQTSAWEFDAYGWLCLGFFVLSFWNAVNNEVSGRARVCGWAPRIGAWIYPLVCLLMAEGAWYLERVSQ